MKENCECTYELSRDRIARKGITDTLPSIACPPAQPGGNTEDNSAELEKLKADLAEAQKAKEAAEAAKTAAEEKATEAAKAAEAAKEAEAQATASKEAAEQAKADAEAQAETAKAEAANANAAKDQAERDKEAAQESEAAAIAKADNAKAEAAKAKEDLNVTIAELVTKQNELTAKDTEIAELKRKLEECQKDKCPEVDVVSLGDETVFSGNSCDEVVGLDEPTRAEPEDHL